MYNVRYNGYEFAWHDAKDRANQRKHGVSFDEAASVFKDTFALDFFDSTDPHEEDRFLLIGMSSRLRLLLVCHCYRQKNSARKANGQEAKAYQRQRHDA